MANYPASLRYNRYVTVSQRVNAERLALLGWGRAILMQLAHPLVAAGVAEHSRFRDGPAANVKRLHSTIRAMLDLSFGAPEDVRRAVRHINAIHDRVRGTLRETAGRFGAGTPYAASDPDLLVWVDATVRDSMLLAYELFVGPLSAGDRDRFWAEGEDILTALRVPADARIQSPDQFRRYLAEMVANGSLAVTTEARALARERSYGPAERVRCGPPRSCTVSPPSDCCRPTSARRTALPGATRTIARWSDGLDRSSRPDG